MKMIDTNIEQPVGRRHSDEIDQIITKVPLWIVRWGITIFSLILIMALSISAVIRYPDTIKLPVKIATTNSTVNTFAMATIGQDNYTKVKPGQKVLIKLKVYADSPPLQGVVTNIADTPDERGTFAVKIKLNVPANLPIKLKDWMTGGAEIVTQDLTVLQRLTKQLVKS